MSLIFFVRKTTIYLLRALLAKPCVPSSILVDFRLTSEGHFQIQYPSLGYTKEMRWSSCRYTSSNLTALALVRFAQPTA